MKIGIIRGPYLNKFEMQSYEPLVRCFDITCYHSNCNLFDVNSIDIPKKQLISLEGLLGVEMSNILRYPFGAVGLSQYMIGLENEIRHMDIAHTVETHHAFSYQAVKAKEKHDMRVVVTQWENIPFYGEKNLFKRKIKEKVRINADFFIAVTDRAKDALVIEGVPDEKITIIPIGVDLTRFKLAKPEKEKKREYYVKPEDTVAVFVGRLVWEKGVYDLIYALKKMVLYDEARHFKLLMIGEGPEQTKIEKLVKELGLQDHVKVIGKIPYVKIHEIYQLSDLFILPSIPTRSWQEQFGMVLVESMASGKPIISTLSGSIPEILGDVGILVPPNDPLSLYQQIKRLVLSERLREKLGKKARKRAEKEFDSKKIAGRIKKVYEEII